MTHQTKQLFEQLKQVKPDEMVALANAMAEEASRCIRTIPMECETQFAMARYRDAWQSVARNA